VSTPEFKYSLVAVGTGGVIDTERWQAIKSLLLEFLPARSAALVGAPPKEIQVVAYSLIEAC
jgi:hypothetical protein